jgi:Cft2 family RNA processing exonuclease
MINGTASYRLAKHFLKDPNSGIFIVGYAEETTPAYRVANAQKGKTVRLHDAGEDIPVRCTIKKFRFSSHARRQDLVKMVERLAPAKVVLLHGEESSIDWIGAAILSRNKGTRVFIGSRGKNIKLQ